MKSLAMLLAGILLLPALLLACNGDDDDVAGVSAPGDETATQPGQQSSPTGSADGASREITVELKNWAIEASESTIEAGKVTFVARHTEEGHGDHDTDEGGMIHQLVVAPLDEGADAGESKFGSPVVNLTDIKMGEEKTAEVELEPGRYELSCLVVEEVDGETINHYEKGMHTLLVVE